MQTCTSCGSYYRLDIYHNDSKYCKDCLDEDLDEDSRFEIELLLNPNGKKQALYEDE